MLKNLFIVVATIFISVAFTQAQPLPSSANEWQKMPVMKTSHGEVRKVLSGTTKTLEHFEIETLTYQQGEKIKFKPAKNQEEFILVKDGSLGVTINNNQQNLGPGSVFVAALGDKFSLQNVASAPLTLYRVKWKSPLEANLKKARESGGSVALEYDEMNFQETAKGGRRSIMRRPTGTLNELEMHITTLNEGQKSHDPHTHIDEEIIVVLKGEVEELINGVPYHLGTGSVIFLSSMDPHGIRNAGSGQCEYYAIRWITADNAQ